MCVDGWLTSLQTDLGCVQKFLNAAPAPLNMDGLLDSVRIIRKIHFVKCQHTQRLYGQSFTFPKCCKVYVYISTAWCCTYSKSQLWKQKHVCGLAEQRRCPSSYGNPRGPSFTALRGPRGHYKASGDPEGSKFSPSSRGEITLNGKHPDPSEFDV